jgi:hypothetical protein
MFKRYFFGLAVPPLGLPPVPPPPPHLLVSMFTSSVDQGLSEVSPP